MNDEADKWLTEKYIRELNRRQQAARIEKMGMSRLATQLHHWDQYTMSPTDLDHTITQERTVPKRNK